MHKIYDPEFYKVVFFSSAPIGVPFLEKLHEDKRFEVTGIVTMPDAPAGRGMKMQENVIKTHGKKIHIDTQTPNTLRLDSKKYADEAQAFQQWLAEKKPDFLVVIAYGKIIPQHILDIPTFWPINVHGSILPQYRGASPIQSAFLHDEKETGITIMKMDAGLDTGDMIDTERFPIAFDWTAKDVISKMQEVWPQFLVDTLRKYGKWLLGEVAQDDTQATHCGKIEKEDGLIDPYSDSIQAIYNKYRAYILWPKIYWMYGDKRVIVEHLILDEALFAAHRDIPLIINNIPNPCIKTLIVKPEWSRSQSWDDFVKGYGK
jgi:methionyl-tRNA formyltransferase